MNSKELRQRRHILNEERKLWPKTLVDVPPDKWPSWPFASAKPIRVLRSRDFVCQIFKCTDGATRRLSFCRAEINNDGQWKDGISWDELQSLKTQAGFGNYDAVEIYPSDYDIVNVANMRHLWIVDTPITFKWKAT